MAMPPSRAVSRTVPSAAATMRSAAPSSDQGAAITATGAPDFGASASAAGRLPASSAKTPAMARSRVMEGAIDLLGLMQEMVNQSLRKASAAFELLPAGAVRALPGSPHHAARMVMS